MNIPETRGRPGIVRPRLLEMKIGEQRMFPLKNLSTIRSAIASFKKDDLAYTTRVLNGRVHVWRTK